jgi:hypothetical protein
MSRWTGTGSRPCRPGSASSSWPTPLPAGTGTAIEIERMVNGAGLVSLAGTQVNVGYELAGQRVRLRMDGTQLAVISHDGQLVRTLLLPSTGR